MMQQPFPAPPGGMMVGMPAPAATASGSNGGSGSSGSGNASWFGLFFLVLVMVLGAAYVLWAQRIERFEVSKSLDEQILTIYRDVLQRNPTSDELVESRRKVSDGVTTMTGLKEMLLNTDEYERVVKMQTNTITPELDRMMSEAGIMERVSRIYREERKEDLDDRLVMPYRDIYIYLEYNEYTYRAFLRQSKKKVTRFNEDLLREPNLTREKTLAFFDKYFDRERLMEEGRAIQKEMEAAALANADSLEGADAKKKIYRGADDLQDCDSSAYLRNLARCSQEVFDKDLVAQCFDDENIAMDQVNLTHHEDMVLRPEFAWSVPQKRPPVCTTLGQKPLVQPVMINNGSLMLGTPLGESVEDTQVGSIMPKFRFQQYVDVPKDTVNRCMPGMDECMEAAAADAE
jgi:hypothetical protein